MKIKILYGFIVLILCSCAMSTAGKYHKIETSRSIWNISKEKDIPVGVLLRYNRVDNMDELRPGSYIFIPEKYSASFVASAKPSKPSRPARPQQPTARPTAPAVKRPDIGLAFVFPARGEIIRKYGYDSAGVFNNGINIKVNLNDDVKASAAGKVIYSDFMSGYGNIILIEHTADVVTVYSHNSKNLVRSSQNVKQGDIIAYAGSTGNVNIPQLHFEIRYKTESYDPLLYLK